MQQSDKVIEPEIVNNTEEQNNKNFEQNKKKKIWAWILFILSLGYGALPTDLIPDIPVAGWIDDATIMAAAFTNLIQQQFFQANHTLNEVLKILKWLLVLGAAFIFLIAVLIVTLILKN